MMVALPSTAVAARSRPLQDVINVPDCSIVVYPRVIPAQFTLPAAVKHGQREVVSCLIAHGAYPAELSSAHHQQQQAAAAAGAISIAAAAASSMLSEDTHPVHIDDITARCCIHGARTRRYKAVRVATRACKTRVSTGRCARKYSHYAQTLRR